MADLIDREALLEFPIRLTNYDKEHGDEHFVLGIESVLEYVEHLPAVDAVPVVRCKDCKYYQYETRRRNGSVQLAGRWFLQLRRTEGRKCG